MATARSQLLSQKQKTKKQPSLNIEVMRSVSKSLVLSQTDQRGAFQGGKVEQDRQKGIVRLSQD